MVEEWSRVWVRIGSKENTVDQVIFVCFFLWNPGRPPCTRTRRGSCGISIRWRGIGMAPVAWMEDIEEWWGIADIADIMNQSGGRTKENCTAWWFRWFQLKPVFCRISFTDEDLTSFLMGVETCWNMLKSSTRNRRWTSNYGIEPTKMRFRHQPMTLPCWECDITSVAKRNLDKRTILDICFSLKPVLQKVKRPNASKNHAVICLPPSISILSSVSSQCQCARIPTEASFFFLVSLVCHSCFTAPSASIRSCEILWGIEQINQTLTHIKFFRQEVVFSHSATSDFSDD